MNSNKSIEIIEISDDEPEIREIKDSPSIQKKLINTNKEKEEEEKCPICLCKFEEPAMTTSCFHKFCFLCILQWSQVTPKCPLCKTAFDSLVYQIVSEREFKKYNLSSSNDSSSIPFSSKHALRRAVYFRGLRAVPFASHSLTNSSSSKLNIRTFNQQRHYWESRLTPWITRELQALLEEEDVHIFVVLILSILQNYELESQTMKSELSQFISDIETFIHELRSFADSFYDLETYDRLVEYDYSNVHSSSRT